MRTIRIFMALVAMGLLNAAPAGAASIPLNQEVLPGTLDLETPSSVSFDPTRPGQLSASPLINSTVTDTRGNGAGWTLNAAVTNFTSIEQPIRQNGSNDGPTASGFFHSDATTVYTISIVQGGSVGTATYHVTTPEGMNFYDTTSNESEISITGLNLNFNGAIYEAGDSWILRVNVIPASSVTLHNNTPNNIYSHRFSAQTDAVVLDYISPNSSIATKDAQVQLTLLAPLTANVGRYTATLTETVN